MKIDEISVGASPHRNDDHVAVFRFANHTDIIVLDGGTSVSECDYIDEVHGDVAWFVHAFTAALEPWLGSGIEQQECVQEAIGTVHAAFRQHMATRALPIHAWPIAAMTWCRITRRNDAFQATLYSLGDCKTLLRTASGACIDLDPFINPQDAILQDAIAVLRVEGIHEPEQRRERMLPMLRARREVQNTMPMPTVLCVQPNGPFQARTHSLAVETHACLLIMTDGFYRLVDPYGLFTDVALLDACLRRGLGAQLDELRKFEVSSNRTGERAVKASDDASAVLWTAQARSD